MRLSSENSKIKTRSKHENKKTRSALDWMTAIDYIKTKMTMDSFVHQYGSVNFHEEVKQQSASTQPAGSQIHSNFARAYTQQVSKTNQSLTLKGYDTEAENQKNVSDSNPLVQRQYTVKAIKHLKVN